jgi:hypothetical protein
LVDETGATAVRAMCLGGGHLTTTTGSSSATNNSSSSNNNNATSTTTRRISTSEAVQKELAVLFKSHQSDPSALYFDLPAAAGLSALVKILTDHTELVRSRMRLELAILPTTVAAVVVAGTNGGGGEQQQQHQQRLPLQRPAVADIMGRAQ